MRPCTPSEYPERLHQVGLVLLDHSVFLEPLPCGTAGAALGATMRVCEDIVCRVEGTSELRVGRFPLAAVEGSLGLLVMIPRNGKFGTLAEHPRNLG